MYLEIDRCANAAELNVLSKELEQVLGSARGGGRFRADEGQGQELLARLDASPFGVDGEAEIKNLEWLVGNHFTFLGYEEFTVRDEADGGHIEYDENPSSV
jgi:glutamate dehydrogenase